MRSPTRKLIYSHEKGDLTLEIENYINKGASANLITWVILGGKKFMPKEPVSVYDFLLVINMGITKQSVVNLAEVMEIPMKDIANLLNISYKTLGRKRKTDVLGSLTSSLLIEMVSTIANGLGVFEDTKRLNSWLQRENSSLHGMRPIELFRTPTGIRMVNGILNKIEEGIYT